jgi:hypothetical protein
MRIRPLDIGVESVGEFQRGDDVHLPKDGAPAQPFLPQYRPLDEILRRPSLEERLPALLQPTLLDPDLLQPAVLTDTRLQARDLFLRQSERENDGRRTLFETAAAVLDDNVSLDREVRTALAALLRG